MGFEVPPYMEGNVHQTLGILDEAAWNDLKRSQEMLRPCMMLHATIKKYDLADGSIEYEAWFGDVSAIGITPEEAYLNFDKVWKERA